MGIYKFIGLLVALMSASIVEARPISWTGGSTIMYKSNSMMSSYYYHYSPSFKYSVGAEYINDRYYNCLLYTSPSPRDVEESRMPSSA